MTISTAGESIAKTGEGIIPESEPTRLVVVSGVKTVKDTKEWTNEFQNCEASNIIRPQKDAGEIRLACLKSGDENGVLIASYPKTEEGVENFNKEGLLDNKLVLPPLEPNLVCDLLFDKWEVDPKSLKKMDDEFMVYIGGHGVLSYDKWFSAFVEYPHGKEFPGVVRTLAARGPKHSDGSDTCVFIHVFNKKYEDEARKLLFGEEKKLITQEKSNIVLPFYPDLFADIKSGHEGW